MELHCWLCRGKVRESAFLEIFLSKRLGAEAGSPWCERRPPGTPESICSPADGSAPAEQVQPCCSYPAFYRPQTWLSMPPRVTVLNASPSTPEEYLAGGRAAAGDSDVETESEAGCSTGLHCQLWWPRCWPWWRGFNWALVKASASTPKPRPKSYCVEEWLFLNCWSVSSGTGH